MIIEGGSCLLYTSDTEGNVLENNPFANPDKADFTITDELYQSYGFGDPRWLRCV